VLEVNGQPRVRWWPVAFALQRLEDKRARLRSGARQGFQLHTRAFAVKGLAALKDRSAVPAVTADRRA
jgi:hypothetical protein